jgi:hypothetical protein
MPAGAGLVPVPTGSSFYHPSFSCREPREARPRAVASSRTARGRRGGERKDRLRAVCRRREERKDRLRAVCRRRGEQKGCLRAVRRRRGEQKGCLRAVRRRRPVLRRPVLRRPVLRRPVLRPAPCGRREASFLSSRIFFMGTVWNSRILVCSSTRPISKQGAALSHVVGSDETG